jgi:hypothetical protein
MKCNLDLDISILIKSANMNKANFTKARWVEQRKFTYTLCKNTKSDGVEKQVALRTKI